MKPGRWFNDPRLKVRLSELAGAKTRLAYPEQMAKHLRLVTLLLGSAFAGYVALWISSNVFSPYPLEYRENAVLFTADLQDRGENPYALIHRPVFVNVYGIGYYWMCYPFTRLFGCNYAVLRLVSCAFVVATCCLLVWALRGDGCSWTIAVVAAVLLFVQLGQGLSIVARPDSLGMFFFFASLVIPYRFHFNLPSLCCNALLSVLGFLTKQYFILGLCLLWLYLLLFESKYKALLFGTVAGLGLLASIWATALVYECYFTETFFAMLAASSRSWAHLRRVGGAFLAQNSGLILILVAGLIHGLFRRRAEIREVQQGNGLRWINWHQFHQPLLCLRGDLAWLGLLCNTLVMVLVLGLNPGNDVLYYHQMITPFLLWICARLVDTTFRKHWLAISLLAVNLLILLSRAAPLPPDRSAHWRALGSLVASHTNVFVAPYLALLAHQAGKPVYDTGLTEYAFAVNDPKSSSVSPSYRERNQIFLRTILTTMRNQQFDLIIITPGICPFFPLEELRRYYRPAGVLAAPMPFDSFVRPFPLVCLVPNRDPPQAGANGVRH